MASASTSEGLLHFADFEADLCSGEFPKNRSTIRLQSQSLHVPVIHAALHRDPHVASEITGETLPPARLDYSPRAGLHAKVMLYGRVPITLHVGVIGSNRLDWKLEHAKETCAFI